MKISKLLFFKNTKLNIFNLTLGFFGFGFSFIGLFRAGIGWDSVYDTNAAIATRSLSDTTDLQAAYDAIPTISEFYGVFIYQAADALNRLFIGDVIFMSAEEPSTYLWQGAVNIFLMFLASLIFGYAIYIVTNSIAFSLFGWAALNTLPIWIGMAHVNFKDAPVAAGLTIISSALIVIFSEKTQVRTRYLFYFILIFGTTITVASRPASLLLSGFIIGVAQILYVIRHLKYKKPIDLIIFNLLKINLSFLLGVLLLWFINPLAKINIFQWLFDSIIIASDFPHNMPQRFAGIDASSLELPWWYAPIWFFAQSPVFILLITIFIVVLSTVKYSSTIFKNFFNCAFKFNPFFIQGLLAPIVIVASDAVIYDAVRHLFFVWPSLIILLVLLIKLYDENFSDLKIKRLLKVEYIILLIISLNLFATVRWAPYSYAYINPIAGYSQENRAWDLDYWGVSAKEGIARINENYDVSKVFVMPNGSSSVPFNGIGLSVFEELEETEPFGLYVFIRWNHRIVPEKCDIVFEIKRDFQTLGMGGICPKGAGASTG